MNSSQNDPKWANLAFRTAVYGACHPFEYGKTLIQLGFEPIAPWRGKTLFGRPRMVLPNIFQYVGYMRSTDGLEGCFRGVKLRLLELVVGHVAFQQTTEYISDKQNISQQKTEGEDEDDLPEEVRRKRFIQAFLQELAGRSVTVIVTHPIHVCAIRCMAQFVGKETQYIGLRNCIKEVYSENGLSGFFSGVVPRLLAEICQLVIASSLTYAVNTYLIDDSEMRSMVAAFMNYLASTVTYPFHVVTTCMCVSGCGLKAGRPPIMPVYTSWVDCWSHLSATDQLWRGSSILWRYDKSAVI